MMNWGQACIFNLLLILTHVDVEAGPALHHLSQLSHASGRALFATPGESRRVSFGNTSRPSGQKSAEFRAFLHGIKVDPREAMPKGPRLNIPDGIYHVMARGNRKATIFRDGQDRERFICIVAEAAERYAVRVFVECRLGNHYHQVVQTPRANLPEYMAYVNGSFAQFSNERHGQIGHVFNERYKPILIDNNLYLRVATGYVITNPVKHGFVDHPGDWQWSSYRAAVGLDAPPEYLSLDWLRAAFPSESLEEAQARFREYLQGRAPLDHEGWTDGPAFGSSRFERELREHIGATLYMASLPRSYRALGRPPLATLFQVPMTKAERNRQMLRAHVLYGYRMSEIARTLYMHPASVSRVVAALRRKARTAVEDGPAPNSTKG